MLLEVLDDHRGIDEHLLRVGVLDHRNLVLAGNLERFGARVRIDLDDLVGNVVVVQKLLDSVAVRSRGQIEQSDHC